ncbi:MAG TPA: glucosamine-6-phosphate isomerase [Chloroflexota bacterium]|nr:glucosamine-6-phosphate isomerase [Chloroflexota bacterium]
MASEPFLSWPVERVVRESPIPLTVLPDPAALYAEFAATLLAEIAEHNRRGEPLSIILPVGPRGQYPVLAERSNREGISWRGVRIYQMDEYLDWEGRYVPYADPLSFRRFLREFVESLDPALRPPREHLHVPDPEQVNAIAAAMARHGPVATCYGGLGIHGHVAFNEPVIARLSRVTPEQFRESRTRVVPLAPETLVMNSIRQLGGDTYALPPMAVTIGMREIRGAGRIRLYCDGGMWQRAVLRRALFEPASVEWPVTLLREHPDFRIVATEETAQPAW